MFIRLVPEVDIAAGESMLFWFGVKVSGSVDALSFVTLTAFSRCTSSS